ncbi:hypothetical protein BDZ89DRAFT_1040582 [Hymenopellis radicata]|nr:hypothetical protein BDZ89DRAFT_1040582 [Hymenopellis radicata]
MPVLPVHDNTDAWEKTQTSASKIESEDINNHHQGRSLSCNESLFQQPIVPGKYELLPNRSDNILLCQLNVPPIHRPNTFSSSAAVLHVTVYMSRAREGSSILCQRLALQKGAPGMPLGHRLSLPNNTIFRTIAPVHISHYLNRETSSRQLPFLLLVAPVQYSRIDAIAVLISTYLPTYLVTRVRHYATLVSSVMLESATMGFKKERGGSRRKASASAAQQIWV